MKKIRINITVPGATPSRLKELTVSLERQGVEVDSVLEAIGVVIGKMAEGKLASLKVGAGAVVEIDRTLQLPPSDAPIQ